MRAGRCHQLGLLVAGWTNRAESGNPRCCFSAVEGGEAVLLWENRELMFALFVGWHNFCRTHLALKTTPAVAAG
jgi:hypothetical protein